MVSSGGSNTLRVFIDSSVLIAAAISLTGSARALINLGLASKLTLVISSLVLAETQRNLGRKAPAALPLFQLFRGLLDQTAVDPAESLVIEVAQTIEPKDAPIVAAALTAQADYLVSYDRRHILAHRTLIQKRFNLAVATPDEVLRTFSGT
jgi:predicted nucleic acid-binding protein